MSKEVVFVPEGALKTTAYACGHRVWLLESGNTFNVCVYTRSIKEAAAWLDKPIEYVSVHHMETPEVKLVNVWMTIDGRLFKDEPLKELPRSAA